MSAATWHFMLLNPLLFAMLSLTFEYFIQPSSLWAITEPHRLAHIRTVHQRPCGQWLSSCGTARFRSLSLSLFPGLSLFPLHHSPDGRRSPSQSGHPLTKAHRKGAERKGWAQPSAPPAWHPVGLKAAFVMLLSGRAAFFCPGLIPYHGCVGLLGWWCLVMKATWWGWSGGGSGAGPTGLPTAPAMCRMPKAQASAPSLAQGVSSRKNALSSLYSHLLYPLFAPLATMFQRLVELCSALYNGYECH